MKKILSVVLAGAMILGMSVSAFADRTWGSNTKDTASVVLNDIHFENLMVVERNGAEFTRIPETGEVDLVPGDVLYFPLMNKDGSNYDGPIDKDWSINIKGNSYVENASFYTAPAGKKSAWGEENIDNYKFVKVEVQDDLDDVDSETVSFKLYLTHNEHKAEYTEKISVSYKFANLGETDVSYDWTNDAEDARVWKAPKGKSGNAVFDFEDDTFFTVKMVEDEKVVLNLSRAYDKKIDKAYNEYDADLSFYNFKGTKDEFTKKGELFIPSAKDDKYIYEVVDGELVEVEATYDDAYKVAGLAKKHKGYVIETKELGYYVVADDELVVAEEDDTTDATEEKPSTDKQNPAMGANDFVGAAVALAVVSVAAAGALALKK